MQSGARLKHQRNERGLADTLQVQIRVRVRPLAPQSPRPAQYAMLTVAPICLTDVTELSEAAVHPADDDYLHDEHMYHCGEVCFGSKLRLCLVNPLQIPAQLSNCRRTAHALEETATALRRSGATPNDLPMFRISFECFVGVLANRLVMSPCRCRTGWPSGGRPSSPCLQSAPLSPSLWSSSSRLHGRADQRCPF